MSGRPPPPEAELEYYGGFDDEVQRDNVDVTMIIGPDNWRRGQKQKRIEQANNDEFPEVQEWEIVDAEIVRSTNKTPDYVNLNRFTPSKGVEYPTDVDELWSGKEGVDEDEGSEDGYLGRPITIDVDTGLRTAPSEDSEVTRLFTGTIANMSQLGDYTFEGMVMDPSQENFVSDVNVDSEEPGGQNTSFLRSHIRINRPDPTELLPENVGTGQRYYNNSPEPGDRRIKASDLLNIILDKAGIKEKDREVALTQNGVDVVPFPEDREISQPSEEPEGFDVGDLGEAAEGLEELREREDFAEAFESLPQTLQSTVIKRIRAGISRGDLEYSKQPEVIQEALKDDIEEEFDPIVTVGYDTVITFSSLYREIGEVLVEMERKCDAIWWFDRFGKFHFGPPVPEGSNLSEDFDVNIRGYDLRYITDASDGKFTPPYQSVKVLGNGVVSADGWSASDLVNEESIGTGAGVSANPDVEELGDEALADPTFTYRNLEINTQKEAENVAKKLAQEFNDQSAGGTITVVGFPEITPHDVVRMPDTPTQPMGGYKYGVEKVEHRLNASDGFITKITVNGTTAEQGTLLRGQIGDLEEELVPDLNVLPENVSREDRL